MARARLISKSLSTSEKYNSLTQDTLGEFCQALYPLLVVHSDDHGRLQGDPFTVKLMCFPGSSRNLSEFHGALWKLNEVGLIHWYAVENKQYLQIIDFEVHQSGLSRRTASKFPEFPGSSVNFNEIHSEENRREEKRREDLRLPPVASAVVENFAPPVELATPEPAGAPAPFAALAAHEGAAETTKFPKTKAPNGHPSLLVGDRVEASRSKKPVFFGARFSVFDWQLRELEAMVGTDAFDVLGFLFELDARHSQSGQVIPREGVWLWLQQQVLGEARRRGMAEMPMASDLSKNATRMMNSIARLEAEERAETRALLEKGGGDDPH